MGDVEGSGHWRQHPFQVVSAAHRQAIAQVEPPLRSVATRIGACWPERPGRLAAPPPWRGGGHGTNAYDVTASGGDLASLTGTVTLSFVNGQNIEDSNGNALTTTTPTGTKGLERVAAAEAWLLARGYGQVRVRSQGATARIEIPAAAIADFLSHVDRSQLVDHFRTLGFTAVGLDLEGLVSGKLNRALPSSPGPLASGVAVDQQ